MIAPAVALLLLAAAPAAPPAPASPPRVAAPLPVPRPEDLKARWGGLRELTADVVQTKEGRYWARPLESRIRLRFRPERIEWETVSPVPSLVTIEGERLTVAVPGAAPRQLDAAKDPRFAGLLRLIRALLSVDLAAIERDFALACEPGAIVLTPRPAATLPFTRIRLGFDAAGELAALDLETDSERTRLAFSRLHRVPGP